MSWRVTYMSARNELNSCEDQDVSNPSREMAAALRNKRLFSKNEGNGSVLVGLGSFPPYGPALGSTD